MPTTTAKKKRKPTASVLVRCEGEAHSNAYIDNCMVCAPQWGFHEVPTPPGMAVQVDAFYTHRLPHWHNCRVLVLTASRRIELCGEELDRAHGDDLEHGKCRMCVYYYKQEYNRPITASQYRERFGPSEEGRRAARQEPV